MCEYCEKRKYILNEKKERLSISKSTFGYYLHYVNNMYIKNLGFINYCPICRTKTSRRWTKIERKGGQAMTKEQEEAIEYVQEQIDYYKEQIKFIEAVDSDYYDEEYGLYKNRVKQFETVLSMLKENSAEIEQKNTELAEKNAEIEKLKKVLDEKYIFVQGARTVYGRLMQLDKESIVQDDLKRRNELNQCIKAEEKYKELYHKALGDLAKADRENIKKDKQIDLMAEQLAGLTIWDTEKEEPLILTDKEEVKQYFERKATNNG